MSSSNGTNSSLEGSVITRVNGIDLAAVSFDKGVEILIDEGKDGKQRNCNVEKRRGVRLSSEKFSRRTRNEEDDNDNDNDNDNNGMSNNFIGWYEERINELLRDGEICREEMKSATGRFEQAVEFLNDNLGRIERLELQQRRMQMQQNKAEVNDDKENNDKENIGCNGEEDESLPPPAVETTRYHPSNIPPNSTPSLTSANDYLALHRSRLRTQPDLYEGLYDYKYAGGLKGGVGTVEGWHAIGRSWLKTFQGVSETK